VHDLLVHALRRVGVTLRWVLPSLRWSVAVFLNWVSLLFRANLEADLAAGVLESLAPVCSLFTAFICFRTWDVILTVLRCRVFIWLRACLVGVTHLFGVNSFLTGNMQLDLCLRKVVFIFYFDAFSIGLGVLLCFWFFLSFLIYEVTVGDLQLNSV